MSSESGARCAGEDASSGKAKLPVSLGETPPVARQRAAGWGGALWRVMKRCDRLLLAILLAAFAVRLVHLLTLAGTASFSFDHYFTDSDMYATLQWARGILAGDVLGHDAHHPYNSWMRQVAPLDVWYRWWGGKEVFQQSPLYPYLVALLLGIGRSPTFVKAVQTLALGVLHCYLMFRLGARLWTPTVGYVAALLGALYGPLIVYESMMLRDFVFALLSTLLLLLLLRAAAGSDRLGWFGAGAVAGLTLLAKESIALFLPLAALWVFQVSVRVQGWRRSAGLVGCFVLGCALVVSPLVVRNVIVGASPIALSNRAAEGIIEGNAADTYPIGMTLPPSMRGILTRSDGHLGAVLRETLATYQGSLRRFAALQLLKLRGLLDPFEPYNNVSYYYYTGISPVLRGMLTYGMVLPLGLVGLCLSLASWRRHLVLYYFALSTFLGFFATIILSRYRLAIVPVVLLYGAFCLCWIVQQLARGREEAGVRRRAVAVAVVTLVLYPVIWGPVAVRRPRDRVRTTEHTLAARVYRDRGQNERAAAELRRLLEGARRSTSLRRQVPNIEHLLSEVERGAGSGQPAERLALLEARARENRSDARAQVELGRAYLERGRVDEALVAYRRAVELAPSRAEVRAALATALEHKGLLEGAIAEFREAIRLAPSLVAAHLGLGWLYLRAGRPSEAVRAFSRGIAERPDAAVLHHALGLAYARQEQYEEALRSLRRALELAPEEPEVHNNLAAVYLAIGRRDEAIRHADRARALGRPAPKLLRALEPHRKPPGE